MMNMQSDDERFMTIEMTLANHEKMLDELNQVIIEQGRQIERLSKQNQCRLNLARGGDGQAPKRRDPAAALLAGAHLSPAGEITI